MKNPFKRAGFDTLISKNTTIEGRILLDGGETTILDGKMSGTSIAQFSSDKPSTLIINGEAESLTDVIVANVTVTGTLSCRNLEVSGILAVKNGGTVHAGNIRYGSLVVEPTANLNGLMRRIEKDSMKAGNA